MQSLPLDQQTRVAVLKAVDQYVFGAALDQVDAERQASFRDQLAGRTERNRAFFAQMLATGDYPHLAANADAGGEIPWLEPGPDDDDARFELGLKWLLDGIEAEIERAARAPDDTG